MTQNIVLSNLLNTGAFPIRSKDIINPYKNNLDKDSEKQWRSYGRNHHTMSRQQQTQTN